MAGNPSAGDETWTIVTLVWNIAAALIGGAIAWITALWTAGQKRGEEDGEIAEWRRAVDSRIGAIEQRRDRQDVKLEQMFERLALTATRDELQRMVDRLEAKLEGLRHDLHRGP